jgi:hypothetical protein
MRAFVISIAVMLVALASSARPVRADAVAAAAQVHLDRGIAAFERKDFVAAHREFVACHELVPDRPNPYRWLALAEIQLGDCAAALDHIDGFIERVPATDPRVPEMARWRELCRRTGSLKVDAVPGPVTLRIDGSVVGRTPYHARSLAAGRHVIVGERAGYRSATRTIELSPGGDLELRLELSPRRTPITRRWWFWPTVGGAALAIADDVFYATGRGDAATALPPITCDLAGCRP